MRLSDKEDQQGFTGAAGVNADSDTLNQNAIAYAIALG